MPHTALLTFCDVNGFAASSRSTPRYYPRLRRMVSTPTARASALGEPLVHVQHQGCTYLDYNATTPVFPEVRLLALSLMHHGVITPAVKLVGCTSYGALSVDTFRCKAAINKARRQVAAMIGAQPDEVYFTASGSESDHWAIWGARTNKRSSSGPAVTPHIVTSAIEHPAVLQYLKSLAKEGFITFTAVGVDCQGVVDPAAVESAITESTCLISVMHSNNEVGSIQPIQQIAQLANQHSILMHSDAAQSIGKVPIDVNQLGVDLLTVVGHKFGAPKGVAALYIRHGTCLENFFHGGAQEAGRRAGTENVLGIVGLGAAAELVTLEQEATAKHMARMRDALQHQLAQAFPNDMVRINGPISAQQRLPNTLSISIKDLRAEELLANLSDELAASAGAACHSHQQATVSNVLQAMQVPAEYALGTLRLSTGRHTVVEDIVKAGELIVRAARTQGVRTRQLA